MTREVWKKGFLGTLGQAIPAVVGLVAIPTVSRGLGAASFGVISAAWTFLSLALVANFGIGRATTKFFADLHGASADFKRRLFWTSLAANFALGLVFVPLGIWLVNLICRHVWTLPTELVGDAVGMLCWLVASTPFIFASTTARGILEAGSSYGILTLIRAISNSLLFMIPMVGSHVHASLSIIGAAMCASRALEFGAFFVALAGTESFLRGLPGFDAVVLIRLFRFGGWASVSTALQPIFSNLDRLLVGRLLGVGSLGVYSIAVDTAGRVSVLPGSITIPLYPKISALTVALDKDRAEAVHHETLKFTAIGIALLAALLGAFADVLLQLWLKSAFDSRLPSLLQMIVFGSVFNACAYFPFTMLHAAGYPRDTACAHLLEVVLFAIMIYPLISVLGLMGAAAAWCFRMALDACLLFWCCYRRELFSLSGIVHAKLIETIALSFTAVSMACAMGRLLSVGPRLLLMPILLAAFLAGAYKYAMTDEEKDAVMHLLRRLRAT